MKFEDLKIGMTVFADCGTVVWIYFINEWNVDETDADTYYFPSLSIMLNKKNWSAYKDSIISKKTENELYHHLVSNCQPVNEMDHHEKRDVLKVILGGYKD